MRKRAAVVKQGITPGDQSGTAGSSPASRSKFSIGPVSSAEAMSLIREYHYSVTMPRHTRYWLGLFCDGELWGVMTLGFGTQPLHTIRKVHPSLCSDDYLEIGKMCVIDAAPRNTESQFLSLVIHWLRRNTDLKFLYTWADGIVGRPGYVYQAANFLYGGFIWTDIYITDKGEKIHPRATRPLLRENEAWSQSSRKLFWMTPDFLRHKGIRHVRGKQFRYVFPLQRAGHRLLQDSPLAWTRNYPKHADLLWKEQVKRGKYRLCPQPILDKRSVHYTQKSVARYD